MQGIIIEPFSEIRRSEILYYLRSHFDCTMFLLDNLENFGASRGQNPNSGNYKIIVSADEIMGVFCATNRGNIILHLEPDILDGALVERILDEVVAEPIPIQGVIGNWEAAKLLSTAIVYNGIWQKYSYESKELTFVLDDLSNLNCEQTQGCRQLQDSDYESWRALRLAYLMETKIPNDLTEIQLKDSFHAKVREQGVWGMERDSELVAITTASGRAGPVVQVGGVFTNPSHRNQGLAKHLIQFQLRDLYRNQKAHQAVLFTAENNKAAQAVYKKIGFVEKGVLGLIYQ